MTSQTVKVSARYQIAVPASVRRKLKIAKGDRLLVDIQGDMIVLLPRPASYTEATAGLGRAVWENVDTQKYLAAERDAWTDSPKS